MYYVAIEHNACDKVLPYVMFSNDTAVQETTGVRRFQLECGRRVTTMLDSVVPHEPVDDGSDDAQMATQRAEEVHQVARLTIRDQRRVDAGRYSLRSRNVHLQTAHKLWVWTRIHCHGFNEKLLKQYFRCVMVIRRHVDLNYEVYPDVARPSGRCRLRPEVLHVVRIKLY